MIILFHSVVDCLFNNEERAQGVKKSEGEPTVTETMYRRFLIDLVITYEFDYVELVTPLEVIEFLREMHFSIRDKPYKKELSMYSRKGDRPSARALQVAGIKDQLSEYFVCWMMAIPGVSENKAIALVKRYKTYASLMKELTDKSKSEKEKKADLAETPVPSTHLGGKPSKIGKALAERVFYYYLAVDPELMVTN